MANPAYVLPVNIQFNGDLTDAVHIKTVGVDRSYLPWNSLAPRDRVRLDEMIQAYGGNLPVPPTKGKQIVDFGGAVVGGNSPGLDSGVAEVTAVQFTSHTIVGGYYWTLSSPTTNHYVWYYYAAVSEVTDLDFTSHTIVAGDYFTLNAPEGAFYVWYDVDASGALDPTPGGTGIKVDILSADTPAQVAAKTDTAIDGRIEFGSSVLSNVVTVTNATGGAVIDAADGAAATGVLFSVPTQGTDASTDPTPGGTGIQVTLLVADTVTDIVNKTAAAIDLIADFGAVPVVAQDIVTVTNADAEDATDAADFNAGINVLVTTQGSTDITAYTATITVDGTPIVVSVDGSEATDFDEMVASINDDLGANATATIVGGDIEIESDTPGNDSSVSISDSGLFLSAAGFVGLSTPLAGVADLESAMMVWRLDNGRTFYEVYSYIIKTVGDKPKMSNYIDGTLTTAAYWDGSVWKRMIDDEDVPAP